MFSTSLKIGTVTEIMLGFFVGSVVRRRILSDAASEPRRATQAISRPCSPCDGVHELVAPGDLAPVVALRRAARHRAPARAAPRRRPSARRVRAPAQRRRPAARVAPRAPCSASSARPPVLLTTQASPCACISSSAPPKLSRCDGAAPIAARASTRSFASPATQPSSSTRSARSNARARSASAARSGPSPAIHSRQLGRSFATRAKASISSVELS